MVESHFVLEKLYTVNNKNKKCKILYYPSIPNDYGVINYNIRMRMIRFIVRF